MQETKTAEETVTGKIFSATDLHVGEMAGRIWQTLADGGPQRLSLLMDEIAAPESVFYMAVGWLAREDKVEFESAGGDYLLRLK